MIQIQITKNNQQNINRIDVSGHANYAEYGNDIVCAAVSTLLQVVGYTLSDRQDGIISLDFNQSGLGKVEIANPTRESYLITGVFEKGAILLSEQYPDHVQIEMM